MRVKIIRSSGGRVSAYLIGIVVGSISAAALFAAFSLMLIAAEVIRPKGAIMPWAKRWRVMVFSLLYAPAAVVCATLARPLIGHPSMQPGWVASLLIFPFLWDFFYYWLHRAQHSIAWLWRFHSVHHSIEDLGAGSGYHHLAEAPLRALAVIVPLSFVMTKPVIAGSVLAFHGLYLHSSIRFHFGRFAWIVADNRAHRVHHSLEPRHFNRNFGAFTMIWDRLFGTAYFPNDEWPDVGLSSRREPASFSDYLMPRGHRQEGAVVLK